MQKHINVCECTGILPLKARGERTWARRPASQTRFASGTSAKPDPSIVTACQGLSHVSVFLRKPKAQNIRAYTVNHIVTVCQGSSQISLSQFKLQ